uniref:Centromere protein P-like n=1 Tax=Saccoglossus kowalevskii TaxID=10224 RepID=A0ABM0MR33_SACKO|nr:PREDICTED: centromere protein P-like [Saccoglossus kowalevskii]
MESSSAPSSELDIFTSIDESIQRFSAHSGLDEVDGFDNSVDQFIDNIVRPSQDGAAQPRTSLPVHAKRRRELSDDWRADYSKKVAKLQEEISLYEDELQHQENQALEFTNEEITQVMKHFRNAPDASEFEKEYSQKAKHVDDDDDDTDSLHRKLAAVTKLKTKVDDRIQQEMAGFLRNIEHNKNLQQFFRGFVCCAKWSKYRHKTFQHYKKVYPQIVQLVGGPTGDSLCFHHPKHAGPIFTINWKMVLTSNYKLVPNIDCFIKVPDNLIQIDEKNTLKNVGVKFRQMVKVLGVDRAIDTMIRTTCT